MRSRGTSGGREKRSQRRSTNRCRLGRRFARSSRPAHRGGSSSGKYGNRRAALPREGPRAFRQRLHRLRADCGSARQRSERRDHRTLDRHRPYDGAASSRVRLGRNELGSAGSGNRGGTYHRVRGSMLGRKLPLRLALDSRPGERRISSGRGKGRRHLRRNEASEHRWKGVCSNRQRATCLRDG